MGGRKTVTIGVTVNLEHYENLRLEVSGEVDSSDDAIDLSRFLDTILGSFGTNDPATAERINSYRMRVFPGSAGFTAGVRSEIPNPPVEDIIAEKPGNIPFAPEIPPTSVENPVSTVAAPATTCSSCGAPVSPAEQKMSQLFTSRTLCRICMKNL